MGLVTLNRLRWYIVCYVMNDILWYNGALLAFMLLLPVHYCQLCKRRTKNSINKLNGSLLFLLPVTTATASTISSGNNAVPQRLWVGNGHCHNGRGAFLIDTAPGNDSIKEITPKYQSYISKVRCRLKKYWSLCYFIFLLLSFSFGNLSYRCRILLLLNKF